MKQHHVRRGKLESDVKENRGINSDLREKMNHMEKDNQIEIRKVKGEWAMKSERVQVLVCEKEGREKILEQLKSEKESWKCKEKEFDYQRWCGIIGTKFNSARMFSISIFNIQ